MEQVMQEWGFVLGVILFAMQELIAHSKMESNSITQLIMNILKFLVGKEDKK